LPNDIVAQIGANVNTDALSNPAEFAILLVTYALPDADDRLMSDDEVKKERRKVTKGYSLSRSFRFDKEDVARLEELARRWRCSGAAVLRRLLAEALGEVDEPQKKGN
jgi:hypothetical protein